MRAGWRSFGAAGSALTLAALCSSACSEIQRVPLGECGNHVVEAGEECDGGSRCSDACHISCDAESSCPAGFGCDVSAGFCRMPSGNFQVQTLAAESFQQLTTADFDGDHRADLLSVSDAALSTVTFFDGAGGVARTVSLPVASSAAAGNVTADRLPDVLLGGSTSTVFRATGSRSFSPLIGALRQVSPAAKLLTADIDCDGQRDFLLLGGDRSLGGSALSRISPSGALTLIGHVDTTAAELTQMEAPEGFELVAARYKLELSASGSFESPGVGECGMLALAVPNQPAVDVYGAPDGRSLRKLSRVSYATSFDGLETRSPATRLLFTDLDSDGRADLLISSVDEQWAAYGLGDGTFGSATGAAEAREAQAGSLGLGSEVLAVGELDARPGVDLFPWDFAPDAQLYFGARQLDLSGDGLTDVAAVGDLRRVDLFRHHPSGLVSRLSVPLNGIPRIEDTGDFDGDGSPDLLLSHAPSYTSPLTVAAILFSPVKGEGSQATDLVNFESVEQLAAASLPDELGVPDASTDIAALFRTDTQLSLGFLTGGTDRLLRSSLPKPSPASLAEDSTTTTVPVIGHFRSGRDDEMVLLSSVTQFATPFEADAASTLHVELLSVDAGGVTAVSNFSGTLADDFRMFERAVAVDLDRDGLDEVYVPDALGLLRLTPDGDQFVLSTLLPDERLTALTARDVDGDGALELLAVDGKTRLLALMGGRSPTPLPWRLALPDADMDFGASVAFLNVDGDAALELALAQPSFFSDVVDATAGSIGVAAGSIGAFLRIYDVDWDAGTLQLLQHLDGLETSGLVTGDFNGDGVDDLAGSLEETTLLLGKPR